VPLITPESVAEILDRADLVELVRGRVNLVKRGNRWVGRCPFHDERTPSFSLIPPDNRRYYCHGCGATGDAVKWMTEKEGLGSFPDALEALAERFGVTVRYENASPEEEQRRRADRRRLEILERAAAFYAEYLWRADEASVAREYLRDRGFDEALLRTYRVGFAPSDGGELARRALAQGYTANELDQAGLGRARAGRVTDFFVNRITFPITDLRGRVLGFGARTLDPNERAKYVNSPEGPRFSKRRLLFGLAQARQSAHQGGAIIVCEGYTDVLAFAKAGIGYAVACMGTSLTSEQVHELRRAAPRIRLCFDGDAAGQRAAWRTAESAGEYLSEFDAIILPAGQDPGGLAHGEDVARLIEIAGAHEALTTYLIASRARAAGTTPAARDEAVREIAQLLSRLPESVEKDEAIRFAAGLLQLSRGMEERLRSAGRQRPTSTAQPAPTIDFSSLGADWERERQMLVIAMTMRDRAPRYLAPLPDEAIIDPLHREIVQLLRDGAAVDEWPEHLQATVSAVQADSSGEGTTESELREAVYRVQLPALERRVQQLRESGDDEGALKMIDLVQRIRAALRAEV